MIGKANQIKTVMAYDYWKKEEEGRHIYHSLSESIHDTLADLGRVDVIQITPMAASYEGWNGAQDVKYSALITYIANDTISILNALHIEEWSASGGTLEYMNIGNYIENIDVLLGLGVSYEDINSNTGGLGDYLDIAPFIFKYTEANWFDEEKGFIIKDEKEGATE